ncbi:TPA: exo-alpha-sialidase [Streptococcus suis]|uniref:sialidase domain-containing protein n=1 Tax=Streptococcus suis TaxID=1307 RepID=UPI0003F63DAF|nr:sialidase domain-containing protein [Streptococcus suis]HEM3172598.1 exo-alpha-sialidase [Streptococcus suis]HEM4060036.1 exo-alpha-sialidase [Streptococcus suis]
MKKIAKSSIYKVSLFSSMVLPAFLFVKQVQGQEIVTTVENQQATAVLQPVVENTELDVEEVVDSAAVGVEVPVFTDPHIQQPPVEETPPTPPDTTMEFRGGSVTINEDSPAKEFEANEVTKVEGVQLDSSNDKRHVLDEGTEHLIRQSENGTIYMEYKASQNAGFHSLFSTSSDTKPNEYTALIAKDSSIILESRVDGGRTIANVTQMDANMVNGEWNAVAMTYEKVLNSQEMDIKLYINGQLSGITRASQGIFTSATAMSHAQLGATKRGNDLRWGIEQMDVRNFTFYNKVLTAEEIARRSALFVRETFPVDSLERTGISEKVVVFEGGRAGQKGPEGAASFRIPALLKTDKGTLIAATDMRHDHSGDWGDIAQVVKRSSDNGQTWGSTIKIVDLKNNEKATNRSIGAPLTIDTALVQDPTTKRIFAIYDMYPEGQALFGMPSQREVEYTVVNGKSYLNLYSNKNNRPFTLRENGYIYTPDGQITRYRVNTGDSSPAYANMGDLYYNQQLIGNIYNQTDDPGLFRVAKANYIWMSYSDDDGLTWSRPEDITPSVKKDYMKFLGLGPGTGITLHTGPNKGRLVVPAYSVNWQTGLYGSQSAIVFYSDDHGRTWKAGQTFNDNRRLENGTVLHSSTMNNSVEQGTEATLVQLGNGQLKMFMRGLVGQVRVATSLDGGQTWLNDLEVLEDVHDSYVQLSAIRHVRNGKEYVLLANAGGPGRNRVNGTIHVAEVDANGRLNWLHHSLIQDGNFAYNSLQYLGNDTFGILYEHTTGNQNAYSLYYKQVTWDYLTRPATANATSSIQSVSLGRDNQLYLSFTKPIIALNQPNLRTSTGQVLNFLGQLDSHTLVYRWNQQDTSLSIEGLSRGAIVTLSNKDALVRAVFEKTLADHSKKVSSDRLLVTGEDVYEDSFRRGLGNLMDGDLESLTELRWNLTDKITLPQTISIQTRNQQAIQLDKLALFKRINNYGTVTKYRIKTYDGATLTHDSGIIEVPYAQTEDSYKFTSRVFANKVELIILEAKFRPDIINNRTMTIKEVELYEVGDAVEEQPAFRVEKIDSSRLSVRGENVYEDTFGRGLSNLMDGNKESLTELRWNLTNRITLPQTITIQTRNGQATRLHSLVMTKRINNNGTVTKYRIKAYNGVNLVHQSTEISVPYEREIETYQFTREIRADRVELIILEARVRPNQINNRMMTLKEVELFEYVSSQAEPAFANHQVLSLDPLQTNAQNGKRLELDSSVKDNLLAINSGTIFMDFKASTTSGFYSLFSTSSVSLKNEYSALIVRDGKLIFESRVGSGGHTIGHITDASQRLINGNWNTMAMTYEQVGTSTQFLVKLYVNGELSGQTTMSQAPFTSATAMDYVQVGGTRRQTELRWTVDELNLRQFVLYNSALTPEEIEQRSRMLAYSA